MRRRRRGQNNTSYSDHQRLVPDVGMATMVGYQRQLSTPRHRNPEQHRSACSQKCKLLFLPFTSSSNKHGQNPPIPLIDNNYFLAFGIIMNSLNCIDGLVTRIRKDRSIAPVLLFCAVCTGTISAAAGATALEVLMIFIPLGIATGFTAIYFTSRPKAPEPKEISEKSSNMV